MMEFDEALVEEFVAEGQEHLQTVEELLLQAETSDGSQSVQAVNLLFRSIHSIKGSAACLGFDKITELTHVMETLLSLVRDGKVSTNPEMISELLDGLDLLQKMFEDISASSQVEISGVVAKLKKTLDACTAEGVSCAEDKGAQEAQEEASTSGLLLGMELEAEEMRKYPEPGFNLFLLTMELLDGESRATPDMVEINRQLESCGTILAAALDTDTVDLQAGQPDQMCYRILYHTVIDAEMTSQLLEVDPGCLQQLSGDALQELIEEAKVQAQTAEVEAEVVQEETLPQKMDSDEPEAASDELAFTPARQESGAVVQNGDSGRSSVPAVAAGASTIRLRVDLLDRVMSLAGEMVLARNQLLSGFSRLDHSMQSAVSRMDVITSEMQETIMRTRMQPAGNIFSKLPRIVRDISRKLDKQMELDVRGGEVELDKTILESLTDPLTHIIRNSCDHGIEPTGVRQAAGKNPCGQIVVEAAHQNGQVIIRVSDDGGGIDPYRIAKKVIDKGLRTEAEVAKLTEDEIINLVLLPGFSTAEQVSDISGRGVGMDVVRSSIERIGGVLQLTSRKGEGTNIEMRLPLTLAIIPSLIVHCSGDRYAIPQVNIEEIICVYDWKEARERVGWAGGREVYNLRGQLLPLLRMTDVMENPQAFSEQKVEELSAYWRRNWNLPQEDAVRPQHQGMVSRALIFAVLRCGAGRFGLVFDDVQGSEEIVVKPMNALLNNLRCFAGATILGDGGIALILDVEGVFRHGRVGGFNSEAEQKKLEEVKTENVAEVQPVLFFRCGENERFALPVSMVRRVERINLSDIEKVGAREFITIGDTSVLVIRPDHYLQVSPMQQKEQMLLVLPRHLPHAAGILAHSIIDNREVVMDVDQCMVEDDGAWGSIIVDGKMAILLDVLKMTEMAMPSWFTNKQDASAGDFACEGYRILVAEDTPFFRNLVCSYLREAGFEVVSSCNGQEALDKLLHNDFDLLVSDIEMPVMNGWELIGNVRRDERINGIPAVSLTSRDSDEDRVRCLECGFDRFESKINRESLLRTIRSLLKEKASMAVVCS